MASAIVHPIVWIDRWTGSARLAPECCAASHDPCPPEWASAGARGPSGAAVSDAVGGLGLVVSNIARYAGPQVVCDVR